MIDTIDGFGAAAPGLPPALHALAALPFDVPPRYELLRVLGSGAMGTVLLARERSAARLVALKVLRETCPLFLERFEREARVLARLVHPAIVRLLAFERRAGRPFLAMAYAPGGNLAQARLEPRALAAALRDVAGALACAHASGIVHRDVKPENVLLDAQGRALLADFGLALEREEHHASRPVAGSLASMSPEQVSGAPVGPASDVFSFGATLYRKLTGAWPFAGRTVADVILAIQEGTPAPPRERVAGVPRPLETLALDCLAKDPRARPAIGAVETELARFLDGRSFAARVARLFAPAAKEGHSRRAGIHPEEWS